MALLLSPSVELRPSRCGCLFGFASERVKSSKGMYRAHILGRLILNLMTLTCGTPRTDPTQTVHTARTVTRTSNSRACTKPPRGAPWKLADHLSVHMSGTETVTTCIVSGVVQREPYSLITRSIEVSDSLTQVASHPNGQYAVKIR